MIRSMTTGSVLAAALILLVAACTGEDVPQEATAAPVHDAGCEAGTIGRFDTGSDLLLAQFDAKPDVDDLHAVAALSTMLTSPALDCVDYLAVAGAYGQQGGLYVPAPQLFDLAFGEAWIDADKDRDGATNALADVIIARLQAGGDVWIVEAGQSDLSAAVIEAARARAPELAFGERVHLVQHSSWNENQTADAALAFVKEQTDYIRIPDGNAGGNGSPMFRTQSDALWPMILDDPRIGPVWREARDLANANNGETGYENPAIAAGGFDFSDMAEAAYIFGYEDMADVGAFFGICVSPALARAHDAAVSAQGENPE